MFFILLIFASIRTLRGAAIAPLPQCISEGFTSLCPSDVDVPSHFGNRSVKDIIISCFATIAACTWTAIHPNIPVPTDCWWTRFKRQMTITLYALTTPELITVWALKQRMGARRIIDEYNKEILNVDNPYQSSSFAEWIRGLFQDSPVIAPSPKGPRWTLAHGFFLQMGGFVLSEQGSPIHILLDGTWSATRKERHLIYNIQQQIVDPPRITEEEIQDRSKGDPVSKIFVIIQTTWFIVQCIARWSQHLPVTELEVVTLGFAMLNGVTYALWWQKPQNVLRPVFLELKATNNPSRNPPIVHPFGQKESQFVLLYRSEVLRYPVYRRPFVLLGHLTMAVVHPLTKLFGYEAISQDRTPMFYVSATNESTRAPMNFILIGIVGSLFGVVHLIPSWFLEFPSHRAMLVWRNSAIIMTITPAFLGFATYMDREVVLGQCSVFAVMIPIYLVCIFSYPIARMIILISSLTSIHSLSPAALQTIVWTTFIPHL